MPCERIELLKRAFPELAQPMLERLAQKVQERVYPMGTVLCQEGELEDTFYIIGSGRVVVSKLLDGETSRILTYQGPGEFFGELALIHDAPRVATVVTLEETTVFELSKQDFMALLESSPTLVVTVMHAVASRLREADRRSIAELRRKNTELSQAYHALETETQQRSSFLTTVAHELRAPLSRVKDSLNLMGSDQAPAHALGEAVESLSSNVDAIVRLVNNILFLQEIELVEPQFQPVAVDEIVRQLADEFRANAERLGLLWRLDLAPALAPVSGDPVSLKQALTALLENALRFGVAGGEICVTVLAREPGLEITVGGPGMKIPPAEAERLFDQMQYSAFDRVSLGLPIAKAVVEQHRGTLRVGHAAGGGSLFAVHLPVASR